MKVLWIVTVFALSIVKTESLNNGHEHDQSRLTYADLLVDSLKSQQWTENEKPCLNTMLRILDNFKNSTLWSVWFLDTLQMPVGHLYGQRVHLGNYDECLNPHRGFKVHPEVPTTQYCLVNVTLTETEKRVRPADHVYKDHDVTTDEYLKRPSKHGVELSSMQWGFCVPEVCQPTPASKIARAILQISHLGALSDSASINPIFCESAATLKNASTTGPNIFKLLLLLLVTTSLFCTWYVKTERAQLGSFVGELAHAFCLDRNTKSLTKINQDELYCINFMRTVTCYTIVGMHFFIFITSFVVNGLSMDDMFDEQGYGMSHNDTVVDTFLLLSGLLFIRGLFTDKWQNPLKMIWKRYVRLVAAFATSILFMVTILQNAGSGPIFTIYAKFVQQPCKDHWFINLLMLGNEASAQKLCNVSTWYVSCDYQLCVVATILFIIYKKNKNLGIYAFGTAFVLSIVIPGVMTYVNNYPAMMFHGVQSMIETHTNVVFDSVYIKSYCRGGPFFVGGVMGYIMYTYKPKDHRKVIGTLTSHLAVVFSLILMAGVVAFGFHYYLIDAPVSTAIYVATSRTIWAIAVCIVIGVSEYGNVPFLNSIYSWYLWIPISRLTYGVYITHMIILECLFFSTRTATYVMDGPALMVGPAGIMVYSLVASLVMWLLVEAPLININNMLLDNTWKTGTKNANGVSNGDKSNGVCNVAKTGICNGVKSNCTACVGNKSNGIYSNGKKAK